MNCNIFSGGKCLPVDCSGILYGKRKYDKCRVCGGDNNDCKSVSYEKENEQPEID